MVFSEALRRSKDLQFWSGVKPDIELVPQEARYSRIGHYNNEIRIYKSSHRTPTLLSTPPPFLKPLK
jgi:hypothetical protein